MQILEPLLEHIHNELKTLEKCSFPRSSSTYF